MVNFADDNTLYAVDKSPRGLGSKINYNVQQAMLWYRENGMQPNPTKFQAIFFGNTPNCNINADNVTIDTSDAIVLLGVTLDSKLKYDLHISNLCIKAGIPTGPYLLEQLSNQHLNYICPVFVNKACFTTYKR